MFGLLKDVVDIALIPVKPVVKTVRAVQKEVCETVDDVVGLDKGTTELITDVAATVTTGVEIID